MHHLTRYLFVASAVSAALFGGCATEEIPQYGDPAKVIGGVGATSGGASSTSSGSASSSSGACMPDAGCAVSFANDVFPILEAKGKCSDAACHAPAAMRAPAMTAADAKATLAVLLAHPFNETPGTPYIVPCNPAASKLMCNLKLDPVDGMNMYGSCAPRMPKLLMDAVDDAPLSLIELNKIAEWITCGALDN